jgi:hypothetical protein
MAKTPREMLDLPVSDPPAKAVTETLTYLPGEGDPVFVIWGGHKFQANLPKELTGHPEGTIREQLNHQIIESARNNPFFMVGDQKPKRTTPALPKTAEEYRAYAVRWINDPNIEHADQLIGKFAKDRTLQLACEVGTDDYSYLQTLFMPRLHKLATMDELNDQQVASLWVQNGINQLPW